MIGAEKCDIKSMNLSDANVTPVGPDAAVLTTKATVDGTCGGEKIPSPTTSASLYIRVGSEWKAAYHNETPIMDRNAPSPPAGAKKEEPKKETAAPASDPLTDSLMAVKKKGWDGWRTQDAKTLQETTAPEMGFVDVTGHATFSQADVIKMWTTGKCDIKSTGPVNGKATFSITPTVAILTYKGLADGTCEGEKLLDLWGTTIAIKDGDTWKAAYIFEAPV